MKLDLNKILEVFNKQTDQVRFSVLAAVVLLVLALDMVLLVMPQAGSIGRLNDQIRQMSDDTKEVLTDRQRVSQLRHNLQQAREQLSTLNARVRPIQEVPMVLSTIASIANEYDVKIDQLIPEKTLQESLTSSPDGKYYGLPVVMKARCGYHMFGRFLNKLENEQMYFIVKDFIIQNDAGDTGTHSFSMTLKLILVDHNGGATKRL